MGKYEDAKRQLLALDLDKYETAEELLREIFQLFAACGIYEDYEWKCKVSYTGGENSVG
jgi:hypothetical protein